MRLRRLTCCALALLALGLVVAATPGCSRRGGRAADGAHEGVLFVNAGSDPADLDPQTTNGVPEARIQYALWEGLIDFDPLDPACRAVVPAAAERWEISADGKDYTFHLRADARWSNGDPVTAQDFRDSYRRVLTPRLAAPYADMLYVIAGAEDFHRGKTADFNAVGIRAPDAATLEITLEKPLPFFLLMLKHHTWLPVHLPSIRQVGPVDEKGGRWTRPGNLVSNGPFRLKSWKVQQGIEVERNPFYWDAARVRLNAIRFLSIESLDVEERAFRAGDLHATDTNIPPTKIDGYRRDFPELLKTQPYYGSYFFRVNVEHPALKDRRVRRALGMAIDREAIVKNVTRGGQRAAHSFVPPNAAYQPATTMPYDLPAARRLLAEAGHPDGRGLPTLVIHFNTNESHRAVAESIQQMWKSGLGVNVELRNEEWKVFLDTQTTQNYMLSRSAWIGDYNDPDTFLTIMRSGNGNNNTGFASPEYDRLLDESLSAPDPAARVALMQKAEAILLDEAAVLPIYFYVNNRLMHPSVKGWTGNVLDLPPFKHIYFDETRRSLPAPLTLRRFLAPERGGSLSSALEIMPLPTVRR